MDVHRLNPLHDPRWTDFVDRHPRASVFHTAGWLEALRCTYGYEPVAFTTSNPESPLSNGIVFCQVRSWVTGRRLVSLPFSDHCEPLVDDAQQLAGVCAHVRAEQRQNGWRYIELRPCRVQPVFLSEFGQSHEFASHELNLDPDIDSLFRACHKSSTQRKVRRAEREGLAYEEGRDETLLRAFYRLVLVTRHRQQLPPQPFDWFQNLAASLGEAVKVRVARHRGQPVAGIMTMRHRKTMVYKYGASDATHHKLGAMHLLFWRTIQEARAEGCSTFDLGRSDRDDSGLLTFKERWGAERRPLTYWRCPVSSMARSPVQEFVVRCASQAFAMVPDGLRPVAGKLLYKHVG